MRLLSLNETTTDRGKGLETSISIMLQKGGKLQTFIVVSDHPAWDQIRTAIQSYKDGTLTNEKLAETLSSTVDLEEKVASKLVTVANILDGRMTLTNGKVMIDHEPIDGVLEAHILRLLKEDGTPKDNANWIAFARFVENLYGNVSSFVREQLFGWLNYENLNGHGFTLTSDGCFIGYKGCVKSDGSVVSVRSGHAVVDGVHMNGQIPNKPGSVIEMPRSEVQDDPSVGCASGLHVGTKDYATQWAQGVLLLVKVNPRDVVSVPTECRAQKIRTCRYTVLEATEVAYTAPTWNDNDSCQWDCEECEDFEDCDTCNFCNGQVDDESICFDGKCGVCGSCDNLEDQDDATPVPASELNKDSLGENRNRVNTAPKGARVSFDYRKIGSLVVKHYTNVLVTGYRNQGRRDLLDAEVNGLPRTFVNTNITNITREQPTVPVVTVPSKKDSTPQSSPPSVKKGDVVSFTYTKADGTVKKYTNSLVLFMDSKHLWIDLTPVNKIASSFNLSGISDLTITPPDVAPEKVKLTATQRFLEEVTKVAMEATANSGLAQETAATLKAAAASVIANSGLAKATEGITFQQAASVAEKLVDIFFPPAEDPGTEEEEEIKRNGYAKP